MSITKVQYSFGRLLISSDALRNCTLVMSMPAAFQISIMYCMTRLIREKLSKFAGKYKLQIRLERDLANCLDLVEVTTHLIVQLRKPIGYPT